jgi:hypothetical protein
MPFTVGKRCRNKLFGMAKTLELFKVGRPANLKLASFAVG